MAYMFNGANNVVVNGGSFVANAGSPPSLDRLVTEVAPNAILNAGGRADEVRCFPGTREEVIEKLEGFMDDNSSGKKRMMWLSGPAGAGKSAILQTVAERCSENGRHAANFFFFRGDSTRNYSKPLVATLVYQLRRLYPALDEPLSACLAADPLICSMSIEAQFKHLISSPIQTIQQSTPIQQQIVIIIDGLDECNNKARDQDQILAALHTLAHADNSPFLILVSSRAEPQLVMSFNRLGSSVESVFLNNEYKPQEDIRLFVAAKFAEIKRDHHLARTLSTVWPTDADIDAITKKSSGQFIYAATVMRYIQYSSSNPALSLVTIIEMPPSTDHNPLAHLDAVYSHIFSKVHNLRAVRLILFARNCTKTIWGGDRVIPTSMFAEILQLAGYNDIEVQSFFADLVAIIQFAGSSRDEPLVFYHASLEDYLRDKSRSTIYYANDNEIAAELSSMCLRNIHDADSIQLIVRPLQWVETPTPELSKSLFDASTKRLSGKRQVVFLKKLIEHIERLYWQQDKAQFKALLQSWSRFVCINNIDKLYYCGVQSQDPSASRYYEQYWMAAIDDPAPDPERPPSYTFLSPIYELFVSFVREVTRRRYLGTSRINSTYGEEEEGHGSREYDNGPHEFSMIRVKFHYQDAIRSMTLTPDTPFSEFIDKITVKFGKNYNDLILKFEDEDGARITLRDDSDYEVAIETARESRNGKAEGKLEIWCQDGAR